MNVYTRPELTDEDIAQANKYAHKIFRSGFNNVTFMVSSENMKLTKEVNEHRAARGIDPLETCEV